MEKEYRKYIFDASALICLFNKEPGFETVKKYLPNAVISSVNIAEVYKYCFGTQELNQEEAKRLIEISGVDIIDFKHNQAMISGQIYPEVKQYGLSLGDRSCIALALDSRYPIVTSDKIWSKLGLDIKVIQLR